MAALTPSSKPIPFDVMFDILARLPVKSLLCSKCVCKDWYNLINSSTFIEHHLTESINSHHICNRQRPFVFANKKYLYLGEDVDFPTKLIKLNLGYDNNNVGLEYDSAHIIGVCNGLVCLRLGGNPKHFFICNPLTRAFKVVVAQDEYIHDQFWYPVYGFGYDSRNDDYKIVAITMGQDRHIWIYSLKTNSWRKGSSNRLHEPPFDKNIYHNQLCYGTFGHGMLHCIVRGVDDGRRVMLESADDYTDQELLQISRFNLSSEEWEDDLGFPNRINNPPKFRCVRSMFLDGFFYISTFDLHEKVDIWIMKEYGVEESWTKLYNFNLWYNFVAFSRTRPKGLWFNTRKRGLVWYDPIKETEKLFDYDMLDKNVFHYELTLCGQSLVSIPDSSFMVREEFKTEDETTPILPAFPEKKKKKQKKVLYYAWSRASKLQAGN